MLSADVTAFRGRYSGLPTYEPLAPMCELAPGPPHLFVASRLAGSVTSTGIPRSADIQPVWRC